MGLSKVVQTLICVNAVAGQLKIRQDGISPTVTIDTGVIIGRQTQVPDSSRVINQFLGIPFGAQPQRFTPAQPAANWSAPYDASSKGPACIQQFVYPEIVRNVTMNAFNNPPPPESEDCLNINVYNPANSTGLPVMFWLYGGSLQFGANYNPAYDGSYFAAYQDVVLVAPNYRTNVFGFPNSPQLSLTEQNLGYLDQRLALNWVQRNIAAFGGDPKKVTIFGESAGAGSVDALVTTASKSPPFRAAIRQSGQATRNTNTGNSTVWNMLISALNCTSSDSLSCARAANASVIKSIIEQQGLSFRPVADNVTSLADPDDAVRSGRVLHVPTLSGTDRDEGSIFTLTVTNVIDYVASLYPTNVTFQQQILDTYAIGNPGISDMRSQIVRIATDSNFQCPVAIRANETKTRKIPTWRYFYNATFPNIQFIPGVDTGVFHSSEIPLVFGTFNIYNATGELLAQQRNLSRVMQRMWSDFAKHPIYGPGPSPFQKWRQSPFIRVFGGPNGTVEGTDEYVDHSTSDVVDSRCHIYLENGY